MHNDVHDLWLVLQSRVRLIVIESWDETRVLQMLTSLAIKKGLGLHGWTCTEGLQRLGFSDDRSQPGSEEPDEVLRLIRKDPQPTLYALCDFHPYLQGNPKIVRQIKDIALSEGESGPTLLLISHACALPPELQRLSVRFSLSLPGEEALLGIVREEAARWSSLNNGLRVRGDNQTLQQVVQNLKGLTHGEARRLARTLICDDGALTQDDLPTLNRTKFQLLDFDGVLSFEQETARFAEVGGLENLKRWLNERRGGFLAEGVADRPKGLLLVGVQGGGKSLAARAVAGLWGLPLLRLDMAALYNKYIGETERNLRDALKLSEDMAPCVLWMDEIEKGIANGSGDDGVGQRLLGTLLTWMADRPAPVFLVATANSIHKLPPELVRKGRFDELFFVDLPATLVRQDIFRIHLQRRDLSPEPFDLAELAHLSEGFSGAEIEQVVVSAFYAAQARQQGCSQELLVEALTSTLPLSVVMAEDLQALRSWAQNRTVPAG